MDLSVVVPLYNEEDNLEPLAREVGTVLDPLELEYELIMVDDGSTDASYSVLSKLHQRNSRLKVVRLKRNFGQTAALAAGLAHTQGNVVLLMDGDGQNDPKDIPVLLDKLREGYDLVSGWRFRRQDPLWSRRLPSRIANALISCLTGVPLHDYGCTLKAMSGEVARDLKLYGEMHRFIPAMAFHQGARIAEVKVNHRRRERGRSKYGLSRTFRVILDLLTVKFLMSYATRPLHIFGLMGLLSGGLGFIVTLYLGAQKVIYGVDIGGRPLLLLGVFLILVGFQFITLGLLGEMLARTYHESQNKPIYVVEKILSIGS